MHFRELNEAQILAVAVFAEEEDSHIYRDFADSLRNDFPATACPVPAQCPSTARQVKI